MTYNLTTQDFPGTLKRGILTEMEIKNLLRHEKRPKGAETTKRARRLAEMASSAGAKSALVQGPDYLVKALIKELGYNGIKPILKP